MPGSARPGASRPHAPTRGRVRRGLDGSGLGLAIDRLLQAADQLRLAAARVAAAHLVSVRDGSGPGWFGRVG